MANGARSLMNQNELTEEQREALEAYRIEMEKLKESDPIVHDFRLIHAKISRGLELQQEAMAEALEVIAHFIKKQEKN